jgi:hypothetical protein
MRKNLLISVSLVVTAACLYFASPSKRSQEPIPKDQFIQATTGKPKKKKDGYDQAAARDLFEFEQIKDPSLGYVPMERMMKAVEYTENAKLSASSNRTAQTLGVLDWMERGPIYDLVGPSGNSRGPGTHYTSGRTRAVLIDTLNDPSGNTVFCGGVAGGLWKCTNFLTGTPNWQPINDRFDNLAISSICQDPSAPAVMYFCTGEATSNADAVYGGGVWKSVNAGSTWAKLPTSTGFLRGFKIVCDAAGNIYLANRNTNPPASAPSGLYRSKDGGASWQGITPLVRTSGNAIPMDIEISSGGRLHASFGYSASAVQHQYTDDAANVLPAAGWNASTGIRMNTAVAANRLEIASAGDVLYAVTTNSANNVDSSYKSVDNGATWTKQNTAAYPTGVANGQGWFNLTLAINPSNTNEFLVGGLDAYRSINSGLTVTRQTFWAGGSPYVHADHHFMQWWNVGEQSRVVIGCDGGVFLSNNAGTTFVDRNQNLAIKQFYDGAIHPAAGSPYLLAGAQDNGVHQLTNPGLSFSTEVTGGDGCFVHINQQNPRIQFGSYVFNAYRRSTDSGTTWNSFTFGSNGLFVNPFDYDDGQNIMYASNGVQNAPNNQILRWTDAHTSSTTSVLTISGLTRTSAGNATTFKVSPFTFDRVYIGASNGKLVRLSNASKVTAATVNANVTDITGAAFPTANLSCVNVGQTDDFMVATFSNYGVGHVWYSTTGGASWTLIDGTSGSGGLPDMPVRWAIIDPQNNSRIFLATEAGVYSTDLVNGANTVWTADINFPTVRTDALQLRLSDNTMVAATHGRGLFTAVIPSTPEIRFSSSSQSNQEGSTGTVDCRGYRDYSVNVSAVSAPTGDATVTYSVKPGSTATEGIDFDFTTNGNFATPSKTQVFTTGVAATKNITIRIYDDAALEPDETFTITFGVTGTTNAFAGSYNNYTITLKDNDVAPIAGGPGMGTVGAGDFGPYFQPFRSNFEKAKSQYIYLASELKAAGFTAGDITSLAFNVLSKTSTLPYNGFTISLKNTTSTNFATIAFEAGATPYFTANYSTVPGINTFTFNSPFNWNGSSNILLEVCFDNATGSLSGSGDNVSSNTTTDAKGVWNRTNTGTGCSLAAAFNNAGAFIRPDIILNGVRAGNPVEILFNASKTAYLSPNDDVYFYGPTGNILARIKNLSGANYACTQVKIDRAGTGAAPFWNNDLANYITSKTFQVIPTTNNASGQYQITLYYTAAEKAGWELATGQNWNTIQMVKVKSQIQNYSPISIFPDGPGAVETVTPTYGTFGSSYTLTGTFSTGFSGFGAGLIGFPLPVALTTFTGRLDNSAASLNWSTSSEQNSKNFDIEKSIDGINYYHIGTVRAAGTSTSRKDYTLRDDKLSAFNYYRLKMNDLDGRSKLSNIVLVKYDVKAQNVWVVNNPFNSFIDLRLAKEATQAKLQLIGANGALVAEKAVSNASGIIHWQLAGNISAGSYVLRTVVDGKVFTHKLIKQ